MFISYGLGVQVSGVNDMLRGPKNGQNFGWDKNFNILASSSAKKVLLTAEKSSVGPELTNISGGVQHGHL